MSTPTPLCRLVEDMAIYPRHAVDDANVAQLVNALKSGVTLPPIVADKVSLRIVDGWHRARAYRRVVGPDAVVDVDLQEYADEAALLLDAVERNSAHGRKLDTIDQIRITTLANECGISVERVAVALHMPVDRVRKLTVRVASAPRPGPGTVSGTTVVALKRPVAHLAGSELTAKQVEAHKGAPGTSYLLITNQLVDAVANGFINREDERLMKAIQHLSQALQGFLKGGGTAKSKAA